MDQSVRVKWTEALRSGDYKQGKYKLRDLGDFYDATGVLCELAVVAGIIAPGARYDTEGGVFFGYQYMDPDSKRMHATGLPAAVCEWAGISYRLAYRIAMMGDEGKNFDQIADYVEERL